MLTELKYCHSSVPFLDNKKVMESLIKLLLVVSCFFRSSSAADVLAGETVCQMTLCSNITLPSIKILFATLSQTSNQIYFRMKETTLDGTKVPFELMGEDTFAPDLWVWASGQGKNLLRLPLDAKILSLGLLTLKSTTMDVCLSQESSDCLKTLPFQSAINQLGKFLYVNVTGNSTADKLNQELGAVCRSTYAFQHLFYGRRGIGYDCCTPGQVYVCEHSYSDDFEFIWYGPIVLMCMIYLIGLVHFYKLYSKSFHKEQMRELTGVVKSISEIKADILTRVVCGTERLILIHDANDIIALREKIRFLDVIGIGKVKHRRILFVVRIVVAILFFLFYYVTWGLFLFAYNTTLSNDLRRLNDSKTVFLNVVGHIGWVYSQETLGIYKYAIFEAVYTALVPPMLLYLYFALQTRKNSQVEPTMVHCFKQEFCKTFSCHSLPGKVLQYICAFLLLLHFACLSGVFIAYVIYLVSLGILSNIDILSPWVIPTLLCLHFFSNSFNSAFEHYNLIKDTLFQLCLEENKKLVIQQNKHYFLPRDLVEKYYIPSSRSIIYTCIIKVFLAITALLLLTLVVLTLQYPYNSKLNTFAPFLGVQVVLLLPYLSRTLSSDKPHQLEGVLLKKNLQEYVAKYVEDNPELTLNNVYDDL